jgi:hypothetical protein
MGIIIELQRTQHKLDLVLAKLNEIAPKLDSLLGTPTSPGAIDFLALKINKEIESDDALILQLERTDPKIDKLQETLDDANQQAPPLPGLVTLTVINQIGETMLQYRLNVPPLDKTNPRTKDVATRTLTVSSPASYVATLNDPAQVQSDTPVPVEADDSGAILTGDAAQHIIGTLVDTDASGNPSDPRPFDIVLSDSIAPPEPGEVGAEVIGQV